MFSISLRVWMMAETGRPGIGRKGNPERSLQSILSEACSPSRAKRRINGALTKESATQRGSRRSSRGGSVDPSLRSGLTPRRSSRGGSVDPSLRSGCPRPSQRVILLQQHARAAVAEVADLRLDVALEGDLAVAGVDRRVDGDLLQLVAEGLRREVGRLVGQRLLIVGE